MEPTPSSLLQRVQDATSAATSNLTGTLTLDGQGDPNSGPVAEFAAGLARGEARLGQERGYRHAPVLELRNQSVGASVNTHQTLGL